MDNVSQAIHCVKRRNALPERRSLRWFRDHTSSTATCISSPSIYLRRYHTFETFLSWTCSTFIQLFPFVFLNPYCLYGAEQNPMPSFAPRAFVLDRQCQLTWPLKRSVLNSLNISSIYGRKKKPLGCHILRNF